MFNTEFNQQASRYKIDKSFNYLNSNKKEYIYHSQSYRFRFSYLQRKGSKMPNDYKTYIF